MVFSVFRVIGLGSVVGLFCVVIYIAAGPSGPFGVTENDKAVEVAIAPTSSLSMIAKTLSQKGILSHDYGFMLRAFLMDKASKLQAGEYEILPHMTMEGLIQKIASGDIIKRSVTVIEGMTVGDVVTLLNENELLIGAVSAWPKEGMLLPATYPYKRGDDRSEILRRMIDDMEVFLSSVWEKRSQKVRNPSYPLKTSVDVLILASLVEKETNTVLSEQPYVAGVFLNRLKLGMKLQCDPTVIYALLKKDASKEGPKGKLNRALTKNDLLLDSPYNTYRYEGLPPTPICCPRKDAIKAVLSFHEHKDLYFVADGKGGHVFSSTLEEHNRHVKKWRQSQKKNS